jgi:hypothetical protein
MLTLRGILLTAILLGPMCSVGRAQLDDGLPTKGELSLNGDSLLMQAGKSYMVTVEGKGFRPIIAVDPGGKTPAISEVSKSNKAEIYFTAPETKRYKIFVSGLPSSENVSLLDYTIAVKEHQFRLGVVINERLSTTNADPKYAGNGRAHKEILLPVQAGLTYEIKFTLQGQGFDPYLYLHDGQGRLIGQDDDGDGYPNAKLIHTATQNGTYKIICTSLSALSGDCILKVTATRGANVDRPGIRRPLIGPAPPAIAIPNIDLK